MAKTIDAYNKTFHGIIDIPPGYVVNPTGHQEVKRNKFMSRLKENGNFSKKGRWESLSPGDEVAV